MPKFSIIVPAYNAEATLAKTLMSIQAQPYKDYEVIVVDDGSTDDTASLLAGYASAFSLITVIQNNQGVSAARNTGAKHAKGDWLLFLDADDELDLPALEGFSKAINDNPTAKVFIAGYRREYQETIKVVFSLPNQKGNVSTLSGTFIIKNQLFELLEGYDTRFKFGENSELFRRILGQEIQTILLDFISLIYKDKPIGGSKNMRNMEASTRLLLQKHANYFQTHLNEKRIYLQVIGVCNMRLGNYRQATIDLWEAYNLDYKKLDTLFRCFISKIPFLARLVYPKADFR